MPGKYERGMKVRAVRMVRGRLKDCGPVTAASVVVGDRPRIASEALRRWVAQADADEGARPRVTSAGPEEIDRPKAENRRLAEANAILRAASVLVAGELDSADR